MGRLANKNILITGGNSGIGLAAAQEFDREGARVAICGLSEKTLKATQETLGAGSLAVRADVSNLADLDALFTTIKREFGHLDGIFVNAGHSEFLPFEEVTEQSFGRVIGSNFKGAYFTIQKALPLLRQDSHRHLSFAGDRRGNREGVRRTGLQRRCQFPEDDPIHRGRGFQPRRAGGLT
ncbi:MAG TPA: SDR family NAD(P)-dependent oxidoreductase [Gemmataceae bacterium]|nr:SDR family NAD(P)-dependent oxidoreductase [Gemmataceae bacterium]